MIIDVFFLVLMAMAVYKGFTKGFIVALFSFLAFFIGLAAALKLSSVVAGYLAANQKFSGYWLPVLSFAIVFIGVILLVRLGAAIIEKTAELSMLGWLNRLSGIVLYGVIYTLLLSIVLFYAHQVKLVSSETMAGSRTWAFIGSWGPRTMNGLGKLLPFFHNMFDELQNFFGKVSEKAV